jgi:hypothetical protein
MLLITDHARRQEFFDVTDHRSLMTDYQVKLCVKQDFSLARSSRSQRDSLKSAKNAKETLDQF